MNTILYATDFSENAKPALEFALRVSQKMDSRLIALHVYENPTKVDSPINISTYEGIESHAFKKNMQKLIDYCSKFIQEKELPNSSLIYKVRENNSIVDEIIEVGIESEADLIVMGSKGKSKLHELWMGSTSKAVIEKAKNPVLTVPNKAVYSGLKKIIYASDLEREDSIGISLMSKFVERFNSDLTVVHVLTPKEYSGDEKMKWFKKVVHRTNDNPDIKFQLLLANDVFDRLNSYSLENNVDLMVMLDREEKRLFDKWFHRDLVKRMEIHSSIPLLSFNEKTLSLQQVQLEEQYSVIS